MMRFVLETLRGSRIVARMKRQRNAQVSGRQSAERVPADIANIVAGTLAPLRGSSFARPTG
jgi:hypothetical protein